MTSVTLPCRAALTSPGVPRCELLVEFQRIGEIRIEPAPEHIDRHQAGDGPHHHLAALDREVLAFQQPEAEIARDIGVLEIGFVQRTGGQDAKPGSHHSRACRSAYRGSAGRSPPGGAHSCRYRNRKRPAPSRSGFPARIPHPKGPASDPPAPTIRHPARARSRTR